MSATHSENPESVDNPPIAAVHVGTYIKVGLMSVVFTILTVVFSFLTHGNILVAMALAVCNAVMIAWFTMHLNSEKASIYRAVFLSIFFFADLILVTLLAFEDRIHL